MTTAREINPTVARCADAAMKAVTRWYAEHLYQGEIGTCLEHYVRDQVRAVPAPTPEARSLVQAEEEQKS